MRILICSQRDLPACSALNQLMPALAGHEVAVMLCEDLGAPRGPLAWLKLFTRELPNEVLFPLLDRCPEPPGQLLTFHHLARAYGVPFHAITEINQGDGYALVEAFRPDLILSLRFDLIFKSQVIRLPRLGILNIHPGTLPRYAGLYAPFRAMLADDPSAGCTLHVIDEGIDSGPIVGIRHLPVDPDRSLFWHMLHLYPLGVELFLEALASLEAGRPLNAQPQDRTQREYRSPHRPRTSRPLKPRACVL